LVPASIQLRERGVSTIVLYTDHQPSRNAYPREIVSPTRSHDCCFGAMEDLGAPEQDGHWLFRYRRCATCGFTVRLATRYLPDEARLASLRETLLAARLPTSFD
jgi:hypothetical protein